MAIYRFGEFEFDRLRDELRAGGQTVGLQTKVAQLLELFLREPGNALTHADIKASVWPETEVADGSVYRLISDTRQVLGDDPKNPAFIKTLAGRGYKFGYPVELVENPKPSKKSIWTVLAVILVLAMAGLVWWFVGHSVRPHLEPLVSQKLDGDFMLFDHDEDRLLLSDGAQRLLVVEGKQQWFIPSPAGSVWSARLLGDGVYILAGEPGISFGLYRFDLEKGLAEKIPIESPKVEWDYRTQDGRLRIQGWPVDKDAKPEHSHPRITKYIADGSGRLVCAIPAKYGGKARVLLLHSKPGTNEDVTPKVALTLVQAAVTGDGRQAVYLAKSQSGQWKLLIQNLGNLSLSHIDLEGALFSDPAWYGSDGVVLKSEDPPRFQYVSIPSARQTLLPEVTLLPGRPHFILAGGALVFQAGSDDLSFLNLNPLPGRR